MIDEADLDRDGMIDYYGRYMWVVVYTLILCRLVNRA
jgi:hypothetical protein